MDRYVIYGIIFVVLLTIELLYFKVADTFRIIDRPNKRSSHDIIVIRGGGIIFLLGVWVWSFFFGFHYPWFLLGLTLVGGISFIDDIHSLPVGIRLVFQFVAAGLVFYQLGILNEVWFDRYGVLMGGLFILLAIIVYVGASNVINFMDGINGITAGYSLAVLIPLAVLNASTESANVPARGVDESLIMVTILSVLVFGIFNFLPKGKAKCFAGDVGSVVIAFVLLFLLGKVILATEDITYLVFLLIYGVDGVLTILHRIIQHENLTEPHKEHLYQLMANELKIGHLKVSVLYMTLQLMVSFSFIFICPDTMVCHWMYLAIAVIVFASAYILFKIKHLTH